MGEKSVMKKDNNLGERVKERVERERERDRERERRNNWKRKKGRVGEKDDKEIKS